MHVTKFVFSIYVFLTNTKLVSNKHHLMKDEKYFVSVALEGFQIFRKVEILTHIVLFNYLFTHSYHKQLMNPST